jgi:hypothetical protein
MRLPRLRVTVKRLMVAVAVVATLIWSAMMATRSLEYRRLAIDREETCRVLSGEIFSLSEQAEDARSKGDPTLNDMAQITEHKKALAEEARAASVYRDRMWRPWRKVRYR